MPFELLKFVVTELKKKMKCASCKSAYHSHSVFVLATAAGINQDSFYGLFLLLCPKCHSETLHGVEVSTGRKRTHIHTEEISMEAMPPHIHQGKISVNEVLDIHNFLKNWKGDVKELFRN